MAAHKTSTLRLKSVRSITKHCPPSLPVLIANPFVKLAEMATEREQQERKPDDEPDGEGEGENICEYTAYDIIDVKRDRLGPICALCTAVALFRVHFCLVFLPLSPVFSHFHRRCFVCLMSLFA